MADVLLTEVHGAGPQALRPEAEPDNAGYFWLSSDVNEGTLYRSDGSVWVQMAPGRTELTAPDGSAAVLWENINNKPSILVAIGELPGAGLLQKNADGTASIVSPDSFAGVIFGSGSPEGVVAAATGKFYINTTATAGNVLWFKESGLGSTGWGLISPAQQNTPWVELNVSSTLQVNRGYRLTNSSPINLSLPTVAATGDTIYIFGEASGLWKIVQNINQYVIFGNQSSTPGTNGSIEGGDTGDYLELVCIESSFKWLARSAQGNFSIN